MQVVANLTKLILIVFYILVPVSYLTPFLAEYRNVLSLIMAALLAAHVGEYFVLKSRMHDAAPDRPDHFFQTLVFGYGHWLPLLKKSG